MVKIRVSYERKEELRKVLALLGGAVASCRTAKERTGERRRAYIMLKD